MKIAAETLNKGVRRVLRAQLALSLLIAGSFFLLGGDAWSGISALYGGGAAVLSTWWLGRRVRRATELALRNPAASQAVLYAGAIQRLVGAAVVLGVGLGVLGLRPIPLIVAFAAGQLGFLVNVGGTPER